MEVLVSVIIPVFNVYSYLEECIISVINQSYKNLEIILIDDGSTDGSEKLCDVYSEKDDRIQVIHQENQGLSAARNAGLEVAKGEYISFLDSDDLIMPKAIESMVKEIVSTRSDIVCCGFYRERIKKRRGSSLVTILPKVQGTLSSNEAIWGLIEERIDMQAWSKLYRAQLFENLCFPVGKVYEDRLLIPYIFERAKTITVLPQPLFIKHRRDNSITATCSNGNVADWLYARKCWKHFVSKHTNYLEDKDHRDFFAKNYFNKIWNFYYGSVYNNRYVEAYVRSSFRKELIISGKSIAPFSGKEYWMYCVHKLCPAICFLTRRLYQILLRSLRFLMKLFDCAKRDGSF